MSAPLNARQSESPTPAGHRGPRAAILVQLKCRAGATVAEVAEELGCSLNAARHHLKELEVEGVVSYDRTPSGVGAPAHVWRLTPAGQRLFPARYETTLIQLLDRVVAMEGRPAAVALLEQQYEVLTHRLEVETRGLDPAARGEAIARVLDAEGYMATWAHAAEGGLLTEHNCPHRLIAERFPEVCVAEERFLAEAFGAPVERRSRIDGGCGTCSYSVAVGDTRTNEESS